MGRVPVAVVDVVGVVVDTRNVVQLYRPRLAPDDRRVWGSVAEDTGLSPAQWADTRNDVNLIDTVRVTSTLTRLPDGDVLTLLDADDRSRTFDRIVGTVALKSMTRG